MELIKCVRDCFKPLEMKKRWVMGNYLVRKGCFLCNAPRKLTVISQKQSDGQSYNEIALVI